MTSQNCVTLHQHTLIVCRGRSKSYPATAQHCTGLTGQAAAPALADNKWPLLRPWCLSCRLLSLQAAGPVSQPNGGLRASKSCQWQRKVQRLSERCWVLAVRSCSASFCVSCLCCSTSCSALHVVRFSGWVSSVGLDSSICLFTSSLVTI